MLLLWVFGGGGGGDDDDDDVLFNFCEEYITKHRFWTKFVG
jgi:hypothetical protein